MEKQDTKTAQRYEQFRVGMALAETARFTADKKVATSLAKQGMALVAEAAIAFSQDPDDWCLTRPKNPWRGPWPRPNWFELEMLNPILDPDYQYSLNNAEVLGVVQRLKTSIESAELKPVLQDLAAETYAAVEVEKLNEL